MTKLQTKKDVTTLTALFTITYMVSYITRINFGAIISEIGIAEGITKSMLSMAVTGSFITYGTGQIVSGICGDRYSPKNLVSIGLIITSIMNFLIPFCGTPYLMTAVWCVNGFAQSFMWPPLIRLMSAKLSEEDYKIANVKVSWGSSIGTISVYLISPLLISTVGWKAVFIMSAACGIIMFIFWTRFAPDISVETTADTKSPVKRKISMRVFISPLMLCVMSGIVCMGMLRDGVTTWMPSYISETYDLGSSISILTGVVLPIFSIISFQISSLLHRKIFKNPLTCAGVIFAAGTVSAIVLSIFSGGYASLSVIFSALLTGCMHGVNLMLISMLPPYFKRHGNVSTAAGVLNACTYIGSAISTYGIALLSETIGWSFTLISWIAVATIGTILCLVSSNSWKKTYMDAE